MPFTASAPMAIHHQSGFRRTVALVSQAKIGKKSTGRNPTDRGKQGTKRSLLTDGQGIPLALTVAGANRPDMTLVADTLYNLAIARPAPTAETPQHLCLAKGYDYPDVRTLLKHCGYTAHIPPKGEAAQDTQPRPGYHARRWVVERTHSWMNRFRALLIRWEKKLANYLAFLHFACAWITCRAAGVFG
jgi:putative transposase